MVFLPFVYKSHCEQTKKQKVSFNSPKTAAPACLHLLKCHASNKFFRQAIMQEARINMIENQLRAGGVHVKEVFRMPFQPSGVKNSCHPNIGNTLLPIWKFRFLMPRTC